MKTVECRKKKIQKKVESLKKETAIAHKERAKWEGQCRRGMNFELGPTGGWTEEDFARPKKKGRRSDAVCLLCQRAGHSTAQSRDCKHCVPPKKKSDGAKADEAQADEGAQAELAGLDEMPLDDDLDVFHDAGTWSSDDDEIDDSVQALCMIQVKHDRWS